MEPFERDDYPFPNQCVAIIDAESEARSRRCGNGATETISGVIPVCSAHYRGLPESQGSLPEDAYLAGMIRKSREMEREILRLRGEAAEWKRVASARHGHLAGENFSPIMAKDSFVYFARSGKYLKIGKAENPASRVGSLRNGGVIFPRDAQVHDLKIIALERGGLGRERELHRKFSKFNVVSEWFTADPEILEYISQLPEITPPIGG